MLSTHQNLRRRGFSLGAAGATLAIASLLIKIPAAQAENVTNCGPAINSAVTTENSLSTTNSVVFVDVPGAVQNFTVPAGSTRCIKVLFTAEAACRGPESVGDVCLIQALLDGAQMSPPGGAFQAFVSEDTTAGAHADEWVSRVGAGNHVVRIQQKVRNESTFFELDDWAFDVQIYQ